MKQQSLLFTLLLMSNLWHVSAQVLITSDLSKPGKSISNELVGVFFEDINFAADGGLYAELIQNRSFEYHPYTDSVANVTYLTSQPLDAWSTVKRGNALFSISVKNEHPIHTNNPNYLEINVLYEGSDAGIRNTGFFGIPVEAGKSYPYSVYLRSEVEIDFPVVIKLESGLLNAGSDTITGITTSWQKFEGTITSTRTNDNATLVLSSRGKGKLYVDMVSLFPYKTFKNRKNGLREDLAQSIADLKPRFLRFPGGCISHGRGIDNMYRWKETVGDVAERNPNWNLWGYHQTYGLGFYEYFLFCEDIGAIPLPVIPAGVSCQFRNREIVPMNQMQPFVDDALDLVEFANGDTSTTWGRLRAQMGHPEPFNLEYICIGNEEDDIPEFRERMNLITNALRARHPEIKIIGTSGTAASGSHYDSLWKYSKEHNHDLVDEHYYVEPEWLLNNLHRYDNFDRNGPKVFVGEWASRDDRLRNAVAEAAYMTGLERNADVVHFSCYAPLLVSENHPSPWRPDLIRFDTKRIAKTPNYYVQQLFAEHGGDQYFESSVTYAESTINETLYTGSFGVGTWNTQARFRDINIESQGTTIYKEDFLSGSSNWTVLAGNFVAEAGEYRQMANDQPAWSIFNQAIQHSEYRFSLKAMKTGGAEGFIIPFGYKDPQNFFWLNLGGWGNSNHAIERSVNGAKSIVAETPGSIVNNQWYDIKIEVAGGIAKVYLNSDLIITTHLPDGPIASSVVKDSKTNKLSIKLVNTGDKAIPSSIVLTGIRRGSTIETVLITGDTPNLQNTLTDPVLVAPIKSGIIMEGDTIHYLIPPQSIQVLSIDTDEISALQPITTTKATVLKISPNPTSSKAYIEFPNPSQNAIGLYVFNLEGKNVINKTTISTTRSSLVLDRGSLSPGPYTIVVKTETDLYSGKLIVM